MTDVAPGPHLRKILDILDDPERSPRDAMPWILHQPFLEQGILRLEILRPRLEDWISEYPEGQVPWNQILERILGLLGRRMLSHVLLALHLHACARTLPRGKKDRFRLNPPDLLKHALEMEEFCENEGIQGARQVFYAAFHYDLLSILYQREKMGKEPLNFLAESWKEAKLIGKVAYRLGKSLPAGPSGESGITESLMPAAILIPLGQSLVGSLYPRELGEKSYAQKLTTWWKSPWAMTLQSLFEPKEFGILSREASSLFVLSSGILRDLEPLVLGSENPDLFRGHDLRIFRGSVVLHLAREIASKRKIHRYAERWAEQVGLPSPFIQDAVAFRGTLG